MTFKTHTLAADGQVAATRMTGNPPRDTSQAMLRGVRYRCPRCGEGALFSAYLKVNENCPTCREALHHQRADDAPPYFTIFIVGHIVLGGILAMEKAFKPEPWQHAVVWLPLTLLLSLLLLPRIKGAMVGLQWALRMHGFGQSAPDSVDDSTTARVRMPPSVSSSPAP